MINGALGLLPLNRFGKACYHSNYHRYARKQHFDGHDHVMTDEPPCCSGNIPQLAAGYESSTYYIDPLVLALDLQSAQPVGQRYCQTFGLCTIVELKSEN